MQKKKNEKKKGEKEKTNKKQNKKRIDMVNTVLRKEKQEVQLELPTNTPALSKKQNKIEAKNQWKQPREK